jgi:intracellular sulfur oxidation DsrE/DsrF family protein
MRRSLKVYEGRRWRGGDAAASRKKEEGGMTPINRRSVMSLAVVALGSWLARGTTALAASDSPKAGGGLHRVALHLNSDDERIQKGALNNIKNLYEEYGPDRLKVELVTNGPGLKLFIRKDTKFAEELAQLKKAYGVQYTACSNTMKGMKVTREDLVETVDRTVPAIVRLIELQEQGWAYIKP